MPVRKNRKFRSQTDGDCLAGMPPLSEDGWSFHPTLLPQVSAYNYYGLELNFHTYLSKIKWTKALISSLYE